MESLAQSYTRESFSQIIKMLCPITFHILGLIILQLVLNKGLSNEKGFKKLINSKRTKTVKSYI